MQDTTTAADETIVTIPWAQLHDSPLQYRKTYSDATIAEIAATITDTGRIHQPLVVRLNYPNPLFRDAYDPQDGFEIVFGHSRKRGGMLAGLAGAPCVVRNMTDSQVRAAQAAENIARADVHPIEEAEGFRAMLDEAQITADELAATLGKSRSYVYGRLKLLTLWQDRKLADEIARRRALLDQVRAATRATARGEFDLRMVALAALEGVQWSDQPEALLAAAAFYGIADVSRTPSTAGASAQEAAACAGARLVADPAADGGDDETDDETGDKQPVNPQPNTAAARPGQMADAGVAGSTTAQADAFEGAGA